MSIILDALRKSEAARRRNEAPALFDAMPTAAASERARPNWPLWAVGAIGVVSLAIAVWLTTQRDIRANPAARSDGTTTARNEAAEAAPASDAQQTAANDTQTAQAIETTIPMPRSPADTSAQSSTANASVATTPAAVANTAPSANDLGNTPPRSVIVANGIAPPHRDSTVAPERPIETPARIEPVAPTAFRSPQSDGPLALADLDSDARKQLPPLKLSMHMWHDTPTQRFVIIDGQRLREGDVLGEVVIERITRDGAALSWRGTTLKIDWR